MWELETTWSLDDVARACAVLDFRTEAEAEERERQRREARAGRAR